MYAHHKQLDNHSAHKELCSGNLKLKLTVNPKISSDYRRRTVRLCNAYTLLKNDCRAMQGSQTAGLYQTTLQLQPTRCFE
jgi:hypothetical protein